MTVQVLGIRKRQEFLALGNNCQRFALPAMVVLSGNSPAQGQVRVGFTASKKVGNAIKRVKAKRRMRAVFDEVVRLNPAFNAAGLSLNFIARPYVMTRDFQKMVNELRDVLEKDLNCQC